MLQGIWDRLDALERRYSVEYRGSSVPSYYGIVQRLDGIVYGRTQNSPITQNFPSVEIILSKEREFHASIILKDCEVNKNNDTIFINYKSSIMRGLSTREQKYIEYNKNLKINSSGHNIVVDSKIYDDNNKLIFTGITVTEVRGVTNKLTRVKYL